MEYVKLKSISRKREYLSARIALKKILMEVNCIELPIHCQIEKDRFGCPSVTVIKENDLRIMNCSISHKKGVAAVCISLLPEMKLGIDVETISEKPLRLRSAFLGKDDSLTGIPESPKYYAVLWACKEAASKAMGLGMLRDFKELCVTGDRDRRFSVCENGKETIHGNYVFFRDFVVAIGHRWLRISEGSNSLPEDGIGGLFS
jgi:phosphopantetheinyl transferase